MYDAHYDLLTILYFKMRNDNKNKDIEGLVSDLKKIYSSNNITGGIVNLFFMSFDEMRDELDISKEECLNVPLMFEESLKNLEVLKEEGIIPYNTDFLYSIEGCDYIKDAFELERLYNMGLSAILPVWNEENKYGSGNRGASGLTDDGVKFLKKAIELGIIIDVSHANERTFFDIMDLVCEEKSKGKEPFVIASHSNVRSLCDIERNLTDDELVRLKEVGGYIGVLVHGGFLTLDNEEISMDERKPYLIEHLNYLREVIGFDDDRIMIATDNMNYHPDSSYHGLEAFKIDNINEVLSSYLRKFYDDRFIDDLMRSNMKELFADVRNYKNGIVNKKRK